MNIELELINTTFESDVRSLVMAFYPGCRIFVKGQQGKKLQSICRMRDAILLTGNNSQNCLAEG